MERVAELDRKGYALYQHGEFSRAIPFLLRALEISEQALGPNQRESIGSDSIDFRLTVLYRSSSLI